MKSSTNTTNDSQCGPAVTATHRPSGLRRRGRAFRSVACTVAALAACFGLVPIAVQLSAPAASAATTSCSATGSGTALSRTGWVASAFQSSADVPANAIDGNLTTRWSSGTAQAVGNWFQVNMGSAQNFDEVDMEVPNSAGDCA